MREKAKKKLNISTEIKSEAVVIKKELGNTGMNSGQINDWKVVPSELQSASV